MAVYSIPPRHSVPSGEWTRDSQNPSPVCRRRGWTHCYLLAAEEAVEEATQSARPTRKNCAARSGCWGRAGHQGGVRQATSPCGPCAFPSSLPWFICSQDNCKAFWVSGCPNSPPLLQTTLSVLVPLCSRRLPALEWLRPSVTCSRASVQPRDTWPWPCWEIARPKPHPAYGARGSSNAEALVVPYVRQWDSGYHGRRLQPGAGGASFWARCAA